MIRRFIGWPSRPPAVIALAITLVGSGCTNQATPASSLDLSSPAQGVIVAIQATGLADVQAFTLRTAGGLAVEFKLGVLENATAFPPGHLAEHQATSSPVLVYFQVENGERVVYRLEDALPSPSPAPIAT